MSKSQLALVVLLLVMAGLAGLVGRRVPRLAGHPVRLTEMAPDHDTTVLAPLVPEGAAPAPQGIELHPDRQLVMRKDATGAVLWATPLDGDLGRARPPHLQADALRAYVTHGDGVTALDARTGAVLWHSPGPADRLLLSGSVLVATECSVGERVSKSGRWLLARDTATGAEEFRVELPVEGFDPLPIEEVAGLFLVQNVDDLDGRGLALLIDRAGRVRHRLDRQVMSGRLMGDGDRLLLTGRDVVRLADGGGVRWTIPFLAPAVVPGGGLVFLSDGGLVAFRYGRINDSGVDVVRLDPDTGATAWATYCNPLRVSHSKYYHEAIVESVSDRLRVTSRGSSGAFTELLDARSGTRLSRRQTDD